MPTFAPLSMARATAALAALLIAACAPDPPRPRGVLLISVDSLRADRVSSYGWRNPTRPEILTTPAVDARLASSGTQFEKAVSTTSWTLPAHMALLTGLPDELHKVQDYPDRLHEDRTLLAEVFADAGWRSAGFWSGPNLHPIFGFGRGFETYVDCSSARVDNPAVFEVDKENERDLWAIKDLHARSHQGRTGPAVVEAFTDWFEGVPDDDSFFAFVHLWDVHYDYVPPREHDVFFPEYAGQVDGHDFHNIRLKVPVDPDDFHRILSLYDGEVRSTDFDIGRILDALEAAGRLDDTLVVFTGDHGDEFLEHRQFWHRDTLYEEVVRVPLIMRHPATVPAGAVLPDLASLVDVAPTILDLCDLPQPSEMWGRSLRPAFDGALEPRPAPMQLVRRRDGLFLRALHTGDVKFIHDERLGGLGLYNLERHPDEPQNRRVPATGRTAQDPRFELARDFWRALDEQAERFERAATGALSEELRRALDAFGYTESGGSEDE